MPPVSRSCHFGSTGRCLVGNLGSDLRFNYSVLGDPVNVASRLECQTNGVPILIGAKTGERAKDKFAMLEIDLVTVKGKTGNYLHAAGPGRGCKRHALSGIAQAMVDHDLLLSNPRLGRRVGGERVVSVGRE